MTNVQLRHRWGMDVDDSKIVAMPIPIYLRNIMNKINNMQISFNLIDSLLFVSHNINYPDINFTKKDKEEIVNNAYNILCEYYDTTTCNDCITQIVQDFCINLFCYDISGNITLVDIDANCLIIRTRS